MADELITTREAAKRLGIGARRVRVLIKQGRLPALRVGRDYLIKPTDLTLPAVQDRAPGRPPAPNRS